MEKTIKAWAAIVPGTDVPFASVGQYGRYYMILCDPDAEQQTKRMSEVYPEGHRVSVPVTITYELP